MKDFYFSFIRIAVAQIIGVAVLLVVLFGVKLLWKNEYKRIERFYACELLSETDPQEVLREETKNGI